MVLFESDNLFSYKNVELESPLFEGMRVDFNSALTKLLKKMIEKKINDGELTLKLSIELREIEDFSEEDAQSPIIGYKVKSTTKESESIDGLYAEQSVLVQDEGVFKVRKAETNQITLDDI